MSTDDRYFAEVISVLHACKDFNGGAGVLVPPQIASHLRDLGITDGYTVSEKLPTDKAPPIKDWIVKVTFQSFGVGPEITVTSQELAPTEAEAIGEGLKKFYTLHAQEQPEGIRGWAQEVSKTTRRRGFYLR